MENCDKYESFFIFSDEKLNEHIKTCEDCKKEQETLDKVSSLIKEARPYYFRKKQYGKMAACVLFLLMIFGFGTIYYGANSYVAYNQTEQLSAEDYGFPVDSYGLIMVGE